jgi:hypothetical protein
VIHCKIQDPACTQTCGNGGDEDDVVATSVALPQRPRAKSSTMSLDDDPPEMSKAEAIAELSDFNNVVQTLMQMANGVPPTLGKL